MFKIEYTTSEGDTKDVVGYTGEVAQDDDKCFMEDLASALNLVRRMPNGEVGKGFRVVES